MPDLDDDSYEYCTRCGASLTMQTGYDSTLPFWLCKGCGQMLINPSVEDESSIVWLCDGCGEMLNIQKGFNDSEGEWKCRECGHINKIDEFEIYDSEAEYQASLSNPYKGLSDESVLELSMLEEVRNIAGREDIFLVRDMETGDLYVKKIIKNYNFEIYSYLYDNPVRQMPELFALFEGDNCLIVIEEYIDGRTLSELLDKGPLEESGALDIAWELCRILCVLHHLKRPIVHRDIKPSNVMISMDGSVFLLDVNTAKWYDRAEKEDTRLFGTHRYAAPEQFGFGFSASSAKTDVYALGILLNVMLTGKLPKEQRASGIIWSVIEKCISLDPENRYSTEELTEALNRDLIIRLCLAGHFSVTELNRALKLYGMSPLYSKNKRDAAIIVAANNRIYDLSEVDDLLVNAGMEKLSVD